MSGGWVPGGLGSTISQLGQAAKDIGSSLETSLHSVAENLEGAFITFGQDTADRAGCVTRTSSFDSQGSGGQIVGGVESPPSSSNSSGQSPGTTKRVTATCFNFEGSERERLLEGQSGSGSMGCGTSYDYRSSSEASLLTNTTANMICDMCSIKFSLINRKKICCECGNYFCGSCLPREPGGRTRTCSRCGILNKIPPIRGDLMKLRVKDLQHFLTRRRINIKSCVEKKDLVELVLQQSRPSQQPEATETLSSPTGSASRLPNSRSWEDSSIRVSDQVPLERSGNFPKSYVESSHRRDWFQEKFGENSSEDASEAELSRDQNNDDRGEVERTPVERIMDEETLVERIGVDADDMDIEEVISVEVDKVQETVTEDVVEELSKDSSISSDSVGEALVEDDISNMKSTSDVVEVDEIVEVIEDSISSERVEDFNIMDSDGAVGGEEEIPEVLIGTKLNADLLYEQASSTPSSPRRFAGQGMVYLAEIRSLDDLGELSTKQIKELLAMNRVNFKGCVEKEELLKIVERLWKQEQRQKDALETMDDDSICKICMDSPIDCVMLECGHMCTCTNCGKQMAECPICRQYVVRVVKTFKA